MCQVGPIESLLEGITAFIAMAFIALVTAVGINSSFPSSIGTPIAAGIAAALVISVSLALNQWVNDVKRFYDCVTLGVANPPCRGHLNALQFAVYMKIGGTLVGSAAMIIAILALSWIPGVAVPALVYGIVTLGAAELVISTMVWMLWKMLLECLAKSPFASRIIPMVRGRQTPPQDEQAKYLYKVATCPRKEAICGDDKMSSAAKSSSRIYTSKTFAILIQPQANIRFSAIKATLTDYYKTIVSIDKNQDIFAPAKHQILDPSYHAIRFRWDYLSSNGIRIEPALATRVWTVRLEIELSDNSKEMLEEKVFVDN